MSNSVLDEARRLSKMGMAIHWLHPKSKRPIGNKWSEKPVMNWKQLQSSYSDNNNIGVRLGIHSQIGEMYLHVIDMDIRVDADLPVALDNLAALFPEYESYPCVASGSGGQSRHFYILTEQPFRSKALAHSSEFFVDEDGKKHWNWEIELFGTGKQVAIPPSVHPDSGLQYTWLTEIDEDMLDMGLGPIVDMADMPAPTDTRQPDSDDEELDLLELVNQPPRGMSHDDIMLVLDALPLEEWCEYRDGWLKTGMAVHHETQGSDEGFDLWCEWSAQSAKFNARDARSVWRSFRARGSKITMGTLLKVMKEEGLAYKQALRKIEEAKTYKQAISAVSKYDLDEVEINTIVEKLVNMAKGEGLAATKGVVTKQLRKNMSEYKALSNESGKSSIENWLADEVLRRFYNDGKHLMRYREKFWQYRNGVWIEMEGEMIGHNIIQTLNDISRSIDEDSRQLILALKASGRGDSTNALSNSIEGLLEKRLAVSRVEDPFNEARPVGYSVMNCTNHELWFKDGKVTVKDHNPDNRLTIQLNVEEDQHAECPKWDESIAKFMRNMPDRDDVIRHLYELMGYILQTNRDLPVFVIFQGPGSDGKSQIGEVLSTMLGARGSLSKSIGDLSKKTNNHAEAGMVGKLMLLDDDFKEGALLPDDYLKKFSEMKMITANPKGRDEFNFVARVVPVILTNKWPKTSDISYGLERRAQIFDMTGQIGDAERDYSIKSYIMEHEMSGILNHCIEGWLRLQKRGRFLVPDSCEKAKLKWMAKRNNVSMFIEECIEVTADLSDKVKGVDLWEIFQQWTYLNNQAKHNGRNGFFDAIESIRGVVKIPAAKSGGGTVFQGMRIINDMSEFEDETEEDLI